MRTLVHLSIASYLALLPCAATAEAPPASIAPGSLKCQPAGRKLSQEGFVEANGIDICVTAHGNDCRNPVILFTRHKQSHGMLEALHRAFAGNPIQPTS